MQRVRLTCDSSEKPMQTSSVRRSRRASRPARSPPSVHATRASFGVALCALKVSLFSLTWLPACVARAVVKKAAPKKKKVAKKKKAAPKKKKATKKKAATKAGARVPLGCVSFALTSGLGLSPHRAVCSSQKKKATKKKATKKKAPKKKAAKKATKKKAPKKKAAKKAPKKKAAPKKKKAAPKKKAAKKK